MSDPNQLRQDLIHSQPDVYRTGSNDISSRVPLAEAARQDPHAVLRLLLDDLIWRVYLESLVYQEDTPALDQITGAALKGDFDLANERTRLAFHLEQDREHLLARVKSAANRHLLDNEG